MARTGLYKSEVKKARDALLAQGKHPSVDAVRIALGNTGSKTTIHKYLKELEEEGGSTGGSRVSISEALQDLVARLGAQLQDEANIRIDEIQTQNAQKERQQADALAVSQREIETLRAQLQHAETAAQQEAAAHRKTRESLQNETITRHTLGQQVADLKERLTENEMHRQSLEDKHRHAREAIDHYRQSVKEQRDQDQRRHEQQVQQLQAQLRQAQQSIVVKQEEVTRLNQDGARLVSDLSHAQKALYAQQMHARQLEQKLASLQATEQRAAMLQTQLSEKEAQAQVLQAELSAAAAKEGNWLNQVHKLELTLATAQAKLAAQQDVVAELRSNLERRDQPTERTAG